MDSLEKLTVSMLQPGLLYQIRGLNLRELEATHAAQGVRLRDLEILSSLERLTYSRDGGERIGGEPLCFPRMREIEIKNAEIESLTCFSGMKDLRLLSIYESKCLDYGGLENLPMLQAVYCTDAQRRALRERYPDALWTKTGED